MADTTCGWQCPVFVTAMPAVKSRNRLPSTSTITHPLPCSTTSGYTRVYDPDTYTVSRASNSAAFGPGSGVVTCGTGRWSNANMGEALVRFPEGTRMTQISARMNTDQKSGLVLIRVHPR